MASVVVFVPKQDRDIAANLARFIAICRDELTIFGAALNWEANYWPNSHVTFGNLSAGKARLLRDDQVMQQPFLDFAKAYHRYRHGLRPAVANIEMRALKCLERALSDFRFPPSIPDAKGFVFDRAAVLCREAYSPGVAYRAGRSLEAIAEFLMEKRLVAGLLPWRSGIPRPCDAVRTGVKARTLRERKLPADELLDALAAIFASGPTTDRDVFTSSTSAMLLCAPSRAGEVLRLPANCEVTERKQDGSVAYGWRFFTSKGGLPTIKWIPDVMVPVAKEAIRRVHDLTETGRRLAAWVEDHPNEFFRHPTCPDVADDEPLSFHQIGLCLGYIKSGEIGRHASEWKYYARRLGFDPRERHVTLNSLNDWVHKRLPETFPWFDAKCKLKYRDALFCTRERQLRTDMATSAVLLRAPTVNTLNDDLGHRESSPGYFSPNVFERNVQITGGITGKVTSHQFRHHLNTIAQRGGLAQSEIAKWSGRADPRQNRVYNHMSEFELAEMLREHNAVLKPGSSLSVAATDQAVKMPVTRQEFDRLTVPTAHVTELGFCVHDYVMSPCQRFRDCINCTEHVCIKGDARLPRLKEKLDVVRDQVRRAETEVEERSIGADRWLEVHRLTVNRLQELIAIMEDPSVEGGAIIRLNNAKQFSPARQAMESAGLLGPTEPALSKPNRRGHA